MVTTTFPSPLGEILLAADGRGLTGLWFEGQEHFGSTLLKEDVEHIEGADAVSGIGGKIGRASCRERVSSPV